MRRFPCAFCVLAQTPILQQSKIVVKQEIGEDLAQKHSNSEQQIGKKINTLVEITKTLLGTEQSGDSKTIKNQAKNTEVDKNAIVIIDNINVENNRELRDSRNIRKELNKISALVNKFEATYSLTHGGIAVHLKDKKDKKNILENWSETNLGGKSIIHLPRTNTTKGNTTVYFHNIPTTLEETSIYTELSKDYKVNRVHRLRYRDSGKLLPVVRVIFEDTDSTKRALNSEGLYIPQTDTREKLEPERKTKVTRCYNCNRLGHIAKICSYKKTCSNCASEECNKKLCQTAPKCINCEGPHPSESIKCQKYLQLLKRLKIRRILNSDRTEHEDTPHKCTGC